MASVGLALQQAIFDLLGAALATPVYDDVPEGQEYPYVVLSGEQVNDAQVITNDRTMRFVYLTVYSDYRGQKEVKTILSNIRDALHNKRPALMTGSVVMMYIESEDVTPDMDGKTYMGNVTLRAMVSHG